LQDGGILILKISLTLESGPRTLLVTLKNHKLSV
jgi:hypothetical protein